MRIVHFLVGLLLIPICLAASGTVLDLVRGIQSTASLLPPPVLTLAGGFVLWLAIYYTLPHPVRTYILAHELTHALWASLMGARVTSLKVGKSGGSVTLSKSNFLIALAPYFFPLYTIMVIACYYLASIACDVERYYLLWLGLVGFSWGFHFTFTITTLLQHQADVHESGRLFSYTVIYIMNVLGICLWIVMVSPATLEQMVGLLNENSVEVCHFARNLLLSVLERVDLQ